MQVFCPYEPPYTCPSLFIQLAGEKEVCLIYNWKVLDNLSATAVSNLLVSIFSLLSSKECIHVNVIKGNLAICFI